MATATEEFIKEGLGSIAGALAKAQGAMANPSFDAQNPHFKNRFASLAAVRNAVVPVLAKHGICLTQDLKTSEGAVSCTTILTHESGQQMVFGPYTLPVSKSDAQGYGSASTYARRYHMMAVAGVVGDADDDAEAAVGRDSLNGLPRIDPRGQDYKKEDMKRAEEYAGRFRKALEVGIDDAVLELHEECNPHQEFYIAVSTFLSPSERALVKKAIKSAQAANGH